MVLHGTVFVYFVAFCSKIPWCELGLHVESNATTTRTADPFDFLRTSFRGLPGLNLSGIICEIRVISG